MVCEPSYPPSNQAYRTRPPKVKTSERVPNIFFDASLHFNNQAHILVSVVVSCQLVTLATWVQFPDGELISDSFFALFRPSSCSSGHLDHRRQRARWHEDHISLLGDISTHSVKFTIHLSSTHHTPITYTTLPKNFHIRDKVKSHRANPS
jgi:hypothetical protein